MRRILRLVQDLIDRLAKTLLPSRVKPVKQTKAAREISYFDPPDAAPSGARVPR